MISTYQLELSSNDGKRLMPSEGYKLYSWLLSQISTEYADELHQQQGHPISQYLYFDPEKETTLWQINLLTDEAAELFSSALDETEKIELHSSNVYVVSKETKPDVSFRDFILRGREYTTNRAELQFITATSFRQNGKYVIFPQEKLIIQSLVNRWNSFCSDYSLDDEDALRMLESGVSISDYSLKTVRYKLKNVYIPAFAGRVTLSSHLPAPLLELWNSILLWTPYSGLGIKTALGMGGTKVRFIEK